MVWLKALSLSFHLWQVTLYLWQEMMRPTPAGTLLKRQWKTPRRLIRYGTHSRKASNNLLHFCISEDTYLADFRQDPSDSTADLDLHIKQTIRGCQWKTGTEEERMINLLYHATIYYEIRKYIQESEPATLKYEMVIEKAKAHERNVLEYKDHQASHGGANSAPLTGVFSGVDWLIDDIPELVSFPK